MTAQNDAALLINRFRSAAVAGDGTALGACFTEDGVYDDRFYGPFTGRAAIKEMLEKHFYENCRAPDWQFTAPLIDGDRAAVPYVWSYTSTLPGYDGRRVTVDGVGFFQFRDGLIARYGEIFDIGLALSQVGFDAERIAKILAKRSTQTPRAWTGQG